MKLPIPDKVGDVLDGALDKALHVQRGAITAYVDRTRSSMKGASPTEVIDELTKIYRRAVIGIGAAAGGTAALPGVGTAAALTATGVEIAAFVEATALYVLAVADVHGLSLSDPEKRRSLVMAVLVGEENPLALEGIVMGSGAAWGKVLERKVDKNEVSGLNKKLGLRLLTRFGTRQGALSLGRALPLGIGAGVGAVGNAALAKGVIATTRNAFGEPPAEFGPRVIPG